MIFLTNEQSEVVYSESNLIFVLAGAGTGKTSTLVEFSKIRRSENILYIVYNASIRQDAQGKFPERVLIHTSHSLAYEKIGHLYKEKLTENINIEEVFSALDYFDHKNLNDPSVLRFGLSVLNAISTFFNSDEKDTQSLPFENSILDSLNEYWEKMKDIDNLEVKMTHDGYLKLYQLSSPVLDFDYIMVDEAQDANEVMLDIVFTQDSKKIFVGDPHQKIYGFRGALNVFSSEKYTALNPEILTLSESFRFGSEIANLANKILSFSPSIKSHLLTGCDRKSVIGTVDRELQYAILFRTNTALFDEAVNVSQSGKKYYVIGDTFPSLINNIEDLFHLYTNKTSFIKNASIKKFKSFDDFQNFTIKLNILEYKFLLYVIGKYSHVLDDVILGLRRDLAGNKSADVILSTTHKAKGLEFTSVILANDFIKLKTTTKEKLIELEEEINLLYVGATRATHDLELNQDLLSCFS